MNEILVTIDFEEDSITLDNNFLLVENDYNSTKLKFEFLQNITGRKVFELLKPDGSFFIKEIENNEIILVDYDENGDIIPILTTSGTYKFEIVIYDNNSKITNSKIGKFKVREEIVDENDENINNDSRIPLLDGLIHETNELKEDVENMDIDATKVDNIATIIITKKDGTSETIEIHDGEKGKNGEKGEQGEPGIQGPQGEPGIQGEPGKDGFISVTSKNEASGETITIDDALESRLLDLKIDGKSEQETRSGKNLYNSTIKQSSSNRLTNPIFSVLPNTTYTFSTGTSDIQVINYYKDIDKNNISNNNWGNMPYTFTTPENCYYITQAIRRRDDSDLTPEELINVQLEKGSVATEFEKYGVSPSPEYPSEIKSVGYTNLFDKDNEVVGYVYSSTGSFDKSSNWNTNSDFKEINDDKVTITAKATGSMNALLIEFDKDKTFIQRQQATTLITTFTLNENTKYIRYCYPNNQGIYDIQIEEGTVAHSYIPYNKYGIDVNVAGKNLFDANKTTDNYYYNATGTTQVDNNNKFINQRITAKSKNYVMSYKNRYSKLNESNTTSYVRIVEFDSNGNFIKRTTYTNDKSIITLDENTYHFILSVDAGPNAYFEDLQIEEGSAATEYEPYKSNTSQLILNEPLRSLPNGIKDETYIENGKLYIKRKVGRVVLDGSENCVLTKTQPKDTNLKSYSFNFNGRKEGTPVISSHYEYLGNHTIIADATKQGIWQNANATQCGIISNILTVNELKTLLSQNNVEVLYELAEPIIEEIGIVSPYTYDGINHINVDGGLPTVFDIKYAQDVKVLLSDYYTKEEVDKLIADIKSLLIENTITQ